MNNGYHPAFQSVHVQLLITIFLAILLWALYQRLRKVEFFRWWAWAWTCSALFLGASIMAMHAGPDWNPLRIYFLLLVLVFGALQPLLLAIGGLSWNAPARPLGRLFYSGLSLAGLASAVAFAFGFTARADRASSFAFRNLPRTGSMVVALGYCCFVFFRHWRRKNSWAALMTGAFCLLYAVDQLSYTIDFVDLIGKHFGAVPAVPNPVDYVQSLLGSPLFFLDLVDICGICLGMILLLIEHSQITERDLVVSERRRLGLAVSNVELQAEIDERHRAEQALRASEDRILQILQGSPAAMLVARANDDCIELANRKFVELFGYSLQEVPDLEKWWPRAYPDPGYREAVKSKWAVLVERVNRTPSESQAMSARVCRKDGTMRDIEFHLSRVGDSNLVSFVDMTAHKHAD